MSHLSCAIFPVIAASSRSPRENCELRAVPCVICFVGPARQHFVPVLRRLWRSPMFTLVTILTIAIGIGANSVIFSVIRGVLLKPLPYPDPDALIAIWQTAPNINLKELDLSPSDYFIFREQNRSF